ncbi:hypothetical protein SKAU_G00071770 [Synaphobranchus kaupii]|uniref:Ig-like domain-containing protein n=1 Tax=Synaphobranchus kaupii TaxID=118154 RepID=A0A9Q1G6X4_SYNKA|nr:hypothetical protein SKAU_G00071770 [Synaphobranchus kaupii]
MPSVWRWHCRTHHLTQSEQLVCYKRGISAAEVLFCSAFKQEVLVETPRSSMLHSFLLACCEGSTMKTTQKDCWYFMVLTILLGSIGDAFLEKPADSILKLEESITLECRCPWSGNLTMIAWVKMPEKKRVAVFHPHFKPRVWTPDEYKGRVEFLRSSQMDGSISIHNTTANDTGLYQCSVQTFPKGSWVKDILVEHLVDMDLSMADPEVVEKGNTFVLRCNYVDKGSVYHVTFEKVGQKGMDTIALCSKVEGGAEESFLGADYRERALVNCSDVLGVSLRLVNVKEGDGGIYRCHFRADAGGQTTTVSLTVSADDAYLEKPADSILKLEESITLECRCPWSGNLTMIAWVKMPEKKRVAVFHPHFKPSVWTPDEYKGRVEFLRSSQMDGSISIHNTTANDTGLYQCSVQTFPKGLWIKDILVEHLGSSINPSHEIYMYMYIGGGVAGLILIILVITLICWHKRKKMRAKLRAKHHPMQRRLLNNYEQAALYDRMKKRGELQEESEVYANVPSLPRRTKRKT